MSGPPLPLPTQMRRLSHALIALTIVAAFGLVAALMGDLRSAVAALAITILGQNILINGLRRILNRRTIL